MTEGSAADQPNLPRSATNFRRPTIETDAGGRDVAVHAPRNPPFSTRTRWPTENGGAFSYEIVRVATAEGRPVADDAFARLCHGIELDGEALRPAQVDWLNEDQLRFVLTQGKKRQIRRMCEAVGLQVIGLKRVRIGAVMLGDLPPGQWRYLRADETFAPR